MKIKLLTLISTVVLVLFGAISLMAQDQPAAAAPASAPAAKMAKPHMSAKAETLSGTIASFDDSKHVLVVTADNVPYNFEVNKATKVMVGGSKAKVGDLGSSTGKQAEVTFWSMKKMGNKAKSVSVTQ